MILQGERKGKVNFVQRNLHNNELFFIIWIYSGKGERRLLGGEDAVYGLSLPRKGTVRGRSVALGKQRQEEMKSLIQNGLQLGENMQTTEASNLIGIIEESIKTTTCV